MKARTIGYWTATVILSIMMLSGAFEEITHQRGTLETHTILGYPVYLLTIIGTWKILGAITILLPGLPRLKEWAYAGLFINMTGAFISHAVVSDYGAGAYHLITTGSIAIIVLISWALRPESRTLGILFSSTKNRLGNVVKSIPATKLREGF